MPGMLRRFFASAPQYLPRRFSVARPHPGGVRVRSVSGAQLPGATAASRAAAPESPFLRESARVEAMPITGAVEQVSRQLLRLAPQTLPIAWVVLEPYSPTGKEARDPPW